MSVVIVNYKDDKKFLNLNDDGNLSLSTLKQYFPNAYGLSYNDEKGETHIQTISLGKIIINSDVKEYNLYTNQHSNLETDEEEQIKIREDRPIEKSAKVKTLRIGWLHKDAGNKKYRLMKKPLGGVRRLKLNESSVYSADRIRQMAIERFADSLEDRYSVELGFFDGRVITDFELPSGETCDLWDYCRAHNTTPYQLNLFILTYPIYVCHTDHNGEKLTRARRRTLIRNGEVAPRDDIQVFYHYVRVSKYSGEVSCAEYRRRDLHTYFLEEQFGDGPAIEQFDPLNHGFAISRIEMNERVLLKIGIEVDYSERSFCFPAAEADGLNATGDGHEVFHDVDEVQGFCDGKFGLGFVPSCTCSDALFTWYRDGEPYRSGTFMFWLGNVELALDCRASIFWCVVTCKGNQNELKSTEFEVTQEMIDRRLDYPY